MARDDMYTPAEDAIILGTPAGEDVQRQLTAAGFPWRSANAIKQRRHYLRNAGARANTGPGGASARLARELGHMTALTLRKERLLEQVEETKAEILECNEAIHRLMAEVRSELEGEPVQPA